MKQSDFIRRLPDSGHAFGRRKAWSQRLHLDLPLVLLLLALAAGGLVVLYSASGRSMVAVEKQLSYIVLAFAVMLGVAQLPPDFFRRWSPWAYLVGLALLALVDIIGVGAKGAQRWLDLPGLPRFQPSELMKLMVPMTVAAFLAKRTLPPGLVDILIALALIGAPAVLVAMQPDLGTAILISTAGAFALFLAGIRWRYIVLGIAALAAAAWPAWHYLLHDYQRRRVLTMFNPEADKLGAGWNIIQSKTAIGSGGVDGKGWLLGTQSHLDFLPESHTDFIIAVLAEEFGLVGVSVLLVLYLAIIMRGLTISLRAQSTFGRLIGGSIILTFFVYVTVNMGMVSGLLPVVGVPLPLVSQGGTAVVSLLLGFGCLMSISTEEPRIVNS